VRRYGEPLFDGLPGQQAGAHHHGRIGGIGATRYGGDNGGTVREGELFPVHRDRDGAPRLGLGLAVLGLAAGCGITSTLIGSACDP
jgi:hypothetical protein